MLIFGSASVEFRKKLNVCMFTENDKQNPISFVCKFMWHANAKLGSVNLSEMAMPNRLLKLNVVNIENWSIWVRS